MSGQHSDNGRPHTDTGSGNHSDRVRARTQNRSLFDQIRRTVGGNRKASVRRPTPNRCVWDLEREG